MAQILSLRGKTPVIGAGCWLAPTATLIGDVELGPGCTVWFGAVLRGDVAPIRLGREVNIQDNAVLHGTYGRHDTVLGDRVSVGHGAVVHGCHVGSDVLIGMGATVLDGVTIESRVIVGAGSVVTQGKTLASDGIYAGAPARRIKELSAEQAAAAIEGTASHYPEYAGWFEADGIGERR